MSLRRRSYACADHNQYLHLGLPVAHYRSSKFGEFSPGYSQHPGALSILEGPDAFTTLKPLRFPAKLKASTMACSVSVNMIICSAFRAARPAALLLVAAYTGSGGVWIIVSLGRDGCRQGI